MTILKRFRVLPAVLGVAAALAAITTTLFGDVRPGSGPAKPVDPARPDGSRVVEDLALTKFSKLPALTYQPRDGETLFAWQIKPTVEPVAARARDILVMVDTSASQAGRPLQQARHIVTALAAGLTPEDRVSLWTVSTPEATKALTRDFVPVDTAAFRDAATALTEIEYGSGSTDLKSGLNKALATIAPNAGRQQLVLFLGDGESAFVPVSEADRVSLGARMDATDVAFFAVPLGLKVNPQNLHGLAALTGGAVVRLQEDLNDPVQRTEFANKVKASIAVPVVKVKTFAFGDEVGESYPTKLPPLRADRTTLVMGKLAKPAAGALTLTINGAVGRRAAALTLSEKLPAPQADHFFLNLMLDQWRGAPHKDAPAMLQSDRALALASTQVKLYRDEFLVQAVWAVTMDRFDDAEKLYKAALKVDPNDKESAAGLTMIEKLKNGKVTRAGLRQKISAKADAWKVTPDAIARTVIQDIGQEPVQPDAQPAPGAAPPQAAGDILREAEARRQIEEQRYRVLVDATIRRGRQLLRTDPDTAYQDLKRQRDEIAGYDGIGNSARTQMVADLEAVMREIFLKGAEVKRQAAAEREAVANTRQRLNEFDRALDDEARVKNQIDQFRQLMQQARFELAQQEAQLMIQERIIKGQSVPPAAVASYIIGQQATQLREWKELVRIREDRFLLTMMQAEKSHIPYPDEPPVHFPPAAVWRELTSLRREAYLNSNLGINPSPAQVRLKSIIEDVEVQLDPGTNLNDLPLFELLSTLSRRYNLSFVVMEEHFKAENVTDIKDKKPTLAATELRGLKMGTFLDIVLLNMNATFIVRPDYIEITTFARRLEEKVTRVFPVADLVIPIPDGINQQSLIQNLNVQNQQLAIFGQVVGAANFQGFGGAFGQQGGGPGGPGGGQFGGAGGGGLMGQLGQLGQQGDLGNQGVGGGFTGTSGGQLGQFGNLGGQFGIQGGNQNGLLILLIQDTVARGEWANPSVSPMPGNMGDGMDEEIPLIPANQLNSLGYYPPARALIVRGTSRYHPAATIKLKKADGGQAVGPMNPRNGGPIVINPTDPARPKEPVAAAGPKDPKNPVVIHPGTGKPGLTDPKLDPVAMKKRLTNDPRKMWSDAIDWTITDPGMIVATADFLMEMDEYGAAAEVLKGSLRKGLTTDDWAHSSLALALQMSQASPAEIERAAVSGIDLDPTDAKAYLRAAKVEAELKKHDQALAFCKQAAVLDPDRPAAYANTLAYAEFATDVKTDAVVWAAHNLLQRDWNAGDGIDYHAQTKVRLEKLAGQFSAAGRDVRGLRTALAEQTQRDLVVELLWQGSADLDLSVTEPGGSVCTVTQKRTTGGGVLRCDVLEQNNDRSEVYTAALAFSGTYKVSVKQAFGKPIGGKATLKVTRFQGTPKESHDLITIDLNTPKPVEIKLAGGARTELATLSSDEDAGRADTTGAALTSGISGFGGGFGTAGSLMSSPVATATAQNLPVVTATTEARVAGIGSAAADLRATTKVNPDRQTMTVRVNPVFGTGGKDVAMPKVPLLPGSEGR